MPIYFKKPEPIMRKTNIDSNIDSNWHTETVVNATIETEPGC